MSEGPSFPAQVRKIYERLAIPGDERAKRVVFLPIPFGEKGPRFDGWQKITSENLRDPDFCVTFSKADPDNAAARIVTRTTNYRTLFAGANVGVLQGEPSGGLCSIDVDSDADAAAFRDLNPWAAGTFTTRGARGCNFWVWINGEFPRLQKGLVWLGEDGKPDKTRPFGEWRATGGQTVIFGQHPSGNAYQWLVDAPPAVLKFSDIRWPAGLFLPWTAPKPGEKLLAPPAQLATTGAAPILERISAAQGAPWFPKGKDGIALNQAFWACYYAETRRVLWSPEEQRFWRYNADDGAWREHSGDAVSWEISNDLKQKADETGERALEEKRTSTGIASIVTTLRGASEKRKAFDKIPDPVTGLPRLLIHVKNGMVEFGEPLKLHDFAPEFYSRNLLNVAFDPDATCQKFLGELLEPAIEQADIELVQKWAGSLLLGTNFAQKMMILTGTAGGGKSTLINLLVKIIGEDNVAELRTEQLTERFETFRFIGKTFLYGADVPGNFMQLYGAHKIKSLCGGDLLSAEPKNGNGSFQIRGEFNIGVTCNSRLTVKLDGDAEAWARRLLIVPYERPKVEKPDPLFVQKLWLSEAPGILNWMIGGAQKLLEDIAATGTFRLTDKQVARVRSLLAESDSVRDFAKAALVKDATNQETTDALHTAYVDYCESRGWAAESAKAFEYKIRDVLADLYRAAPARHIKNEEGKTVRGYRGIRLALETATAGAAEDPEQSSFAA